MSAPAPSDTKTIRVSTLEGKPVYGGEQRADSVRAGLAAAGGGRVLVHDAARPFVSTELISRAIDAAAEHGAAIVALPVRDTVKLVESAGGHAVITGTIARDTIYLAQTPQAFRAAPLLHAYREAAAAEFEGTDTSSSVERFSDIEVRSFQGDPRNLKVTFSQDLFLAERLLADTHHRLK